MKCYEFHIKFTKRLSKRSKEGISEIIVHNYNNTLIQYTYTLPMCSRQFGGFDILIGLAPFWRNFLPLQVPEFVYRYVKRGEKRILLLYFLFLWYTLKLITFLNSKYTMIWFSLWKSAIYYLKSEGRIVKFSLQFGFIRFFHTSKFSTQKLREIYAVQCDEVHILDN